MRLSVFFCILGKNLKNHLRRKLLNENKFFFQKTISNEKLKSKFTPKINFFLHNVEFELYTFENCNHDARFARVKYVKELQCARGAHEDARLHAFSLFFALVIIRAALGWIPTAQCESYAAS